MAVSLNFTRVDPDAESSAPPLVIAHGFLGQGRNFATLARGFAKNRSVISVDMRNHGDSPWDDRMDYEAMADDLAAVIETEAGGHASVLGHSMGGKAAMYLALKYPHLLASLIVGDIAPVAYDHSYSEELDAMQSLKLDGITRRAQADAILRPKITQAAMRAFLLQNMSVSPEGSRWKSNLSVFQATMPTITGWQAPSGNDGFKGPTLFITGANSDYVLPDHHLNIRFLFPAVEFHAIEGAGHWLHAERPKPFAAGIEAFLAAHSV